MTPFSTNFRDIIRCKGAMQRHLRCVYPGIYGKFIRTSIPRLETIRQDKTNTLLIHLTD